MVDSIRDKGEGDNKNSKAHPKVHWNITCVEHFYKVMERFVKQPAERKPDRHIHNALHSKIGAVDKKKEKRQHNKDRFNALMQFFFHKLHDDYKK